MRIATLHARRAAQALDGVLHGQRVHDGGQHAHVIAGGAVDAGPGEARAAEDVAAADDAGHLHAHSLNLEHFAGDALEHRRIDAELGRAQQRFSGKLDENAFVRRGHLLDSPFPCSDGLSTRCALCHKENPARGGVFGSASAWLPEGQSWSGPL